MKKLPVSRNRKSAMTLTELMIASSIMLGVSVAVMGLFITVLRQERTNLRMLRMAYQSQWLHTELRRAASYGSAISTTNTTVRFTKPNGTVSELRYQDDDNNSATIGNNRILYDPDVSVANNQLVEVKFVSPLVVGGVEQPIFQRFAGTPAPLVVEFRIGDRTGPIPRASRFADATAKKDDAFTGPGLQSLVFRAAFAPRIVE